MMAKSVRTVLAKRQQNKDSPEICSIRMRTFVRNNSFRTIRSSWQLVGVYFCECFIWLEWKYENTNVLINSCQLCLLSRNNYPTTTMSGSCKSNKTKNKRISNHRSWISDNSVVAILFEDQLKIRKALISYWMEGRNRNSPKRDALCWFSRWNRWDSVETVPRWSNVAYGRFPKMRLTEFREHAPISRMPPQLRWCRIRMAQKYYPWG